MHTDLAVILVQLAQDHLEKGGFACAIAPHQPDAAARGQVGGGALQDLPPSDPDRDVVNCEHLEGLITALAPGSNPLHNPAAFNFSGAPMAVERTLSIIKPDATRRNLTGKIIAKFEDAGLRVIASRRIKLSQADAEAFYGVHRERPFFKDLVQFMISGPVVVQVLEGENAIAKNRELMGATAPKKADKGTIRADFADSIDANAVHGSDAPET